MQTDFDQKRRFQAPILRERIWWGAGTNAPAQWAAKLAMNLQSSTLKIDESGKPFHVLQAKHIRLYRAAWKEAGHAPLFPPRTRVCTRLSYAS